MLMGGFIKPSVIGEFLKDKLSVVSPDPSVGDSWRAYLRSQGAVGLHTHELEFQWLRLQGFTGTFSDMFYQKFGDRDKAREYFIDGSFFTNFAKTSSLSQAMAEGKLRNVVLYGQSTQTSVPTPNAPVPIVSTTGNQTVQSQGKNLLPPDTFDTGMIMNGTNTYNVPAKTITFTTATVNNGRFKTLGTGVLPFVNSYIFSVEVRTSVAMTVRVGFESNVTSVAIPANTWVRIASRNTSTNRTVLFYGYPSVVGKTMEFRNWQLEYDSSANTVPSSYAPYIDSTQALPLSTTQLRSLPNGVSDRIYKSGSSWFLEQNVGTVVLNGTGVIWNYLTTTVSTDYAYFHTTTFDSVIKGGAGQKVIADKLDSFATHLGVASVITTETISGSDGNDSKMRIFVLKSRLTANTPAAFYTWLAANNVTAQYALATPITTAITDPTLITALENIRTYQGITNITASTPIAGQYPRP